MGASITRTSLVPNQARAFIVAPPSTGLYSGVVSVGTVPNRYRAVISSNFNSGKDDVRFGKRSQQLAWLN